MNDKVLCSSTKLIRGVLLIRHPHLSLTYSFMGR